jgi:Asp-tRNA(Asn)/Glu-tRNA(Gln) amidotransferase A subunit family amidase
MSRIAVVACGALAADVRRIAVRRGWDVDVHPIPALLHNQPEEITPAVARAAARLRSAGYESVALAYGDCGTYGALDELGLKRLAGEHCYDVFASNEVRAALHEEPGTYFLTDFLARTFEHTVWRQLGLDRYPELREDYFRHYTRVMWLAQRPVAATRAAAARAAERLGLPLVVREVGDAGLERQLESLVSLS